MMKRWLGLFATALLIFVGALLYNSSLFVKNATSREVKVEEHRIPVQYTEKEKNEEVQDSQTVVLLKLLRDKVDSWLKSINERIEREDITRFEVRFLEILRNILEWMKQKLDAKIESSDEPVPQESKKRELRETRQKDFMLFEIG